MKYQLYKNASKNYLRIIQGYPQRMRLQRRLYNIVFSLKFPDYKNKMHLGESKILYSLFREDIKVKLYHNKMS